MSDSRQIGYGVPWCSYAIRDETGALLYSGSTSDVRRRLHEHGKSRLEKWGAAYVDIAVHDGRWRAALAEKAAGQGRYGRLPGGVGRALALRLSDAEKIEALSHPAMRRLGLYDITCQWHIRVGEARRLLSLARLSPVPVHPPLAIDRMTVRKARGK